MSVFKVNEEPKEKKREIDKSWHSFEMVKIELIQECIKHTIYPESWLKKQTIKSLRWLANRHMAQLKTESES